MSLPTDSIGTDIVFRLSCCNVRSSGLAPTDDLVEFWRSMVKVIAGPGVWWQRYPRWCCGRQSPPCTFLHDFKTM